MSTRFRVTVLPSFRHGDDVRRERATELLEASSLVSSVAEASDCASIGSLADELFAAAVALLDAASSPSCDCTREHGSENERAKALGAPKLSPSPQLPRLV